MVATVLSLSACRTSEPSAVGTYPIVFDLSGLSNQPTVLLLYNRAGSRALDADRHFVINFGHDDEMSGTWSQDESQVSMEGKAPVG